MPVEIGPFQDIVEVGWSNKPRLLILRCLVTPTFTCGFNFTARIISDVFGGEIRFGIWRLPGEGIQVQNVLGVDDAERDIGRSTAKFSVVTGEEWGMALIFDLAAVREAFLATTEGDSGGADYPLEIGIEISGASFNGAVEDREALPLDLSATLHKGGRGEYVQVVRGDTVYDWSALEVSSTSVERQIDTTINFTTEAGEESSNFGRGMLMETLYAGLEEMTLRWEAALT